MAAQPQAHGSRLDKFAIAAALREIAALLALTGGDRFRAQAYAAGASAVETLVEDVATLAREGRLTETRGIGNALAAVIAELDQTATSRLLEKLRAQVPRGAAELSCVPGMTLRRMRALADALQVDSVASLQRACEAHRVRGVRGFGPKTEDALLEGIRRFTAPEGDGGEPQTLLVDAIDIAERLCAYARACPDVHDAAIVGAVRRWKETVGTLDVAVCSPDPASAIEALARYPETIGMESRSEDHVILRIADGKRARFHVVPPSRWGGALVRFTGSPEHIARLDALASAHGVEIDPPAAETEADVYRRLGLSFIPPELREDAGEIELAEKGDTFGDLVQLDDVRGMVHCHTTYSDGRSTILEMAREAEAMGMQYLTITDHSPTAHYAGGVDLDRLKQQWDEIAQAQEQVRVKLLRGTESDILADGALDYPDPILERLDVIIASIHGRMKMDEGAMTERIVRAMRLPVFKIWGHALGRLVLRRPPIACRVEEILDVIAGSPAAIEVNGDPYRLDLPPEWIREARERGIRFAISVDAHSTRGMHNLVYGVAMARRGGVRRSEVLNAMGAAEFARHVRPAQTRS